jgi:hypothetical protein
MVKPNLFGFQEEALTYASRAFSWLNQLDFAWTGHFCRGHILLIGWHTLAENFFLLKDENYARGVMICSETKNSTAYGELLESID